MKKNLIRLIGIIFLTMFVAACGSSGGGGGNNADNKVTDNDTQTATDLFVVAKSQSDQYVNFVFNDFDQYMGNYYNDVANGKYRLKFSNVFGFTPQGQPVINTENKSVSFRALVSGNENIYFKIIGVNDNDPDDIAWPWVKNPLYEDWMYDMGSTQVLSMNIQYVDGQYVVSPVEGDFTEKSYLAYDDKTNSLNIKSFILTNHFTMNEIESVTMYYNQEGIESEKEIVLNDSPWQKIFNSLPDGLTTMNFEIVSKSGETRWGSELANDKFVKVINDEGHERICIFKENGAIRPPTDSELKGEDQTAPTLYLTDVFDGDVIAVDHTFKLSFDEAVVADDYSVFISDGVYNEDVSVTTDKSGNVFVDPVLNLKHNTKYTITVTSDVTDLAGNHFAGYTFSVITENEDVAYAYRIVPSDGSEDVATDIKVEIYFNKSTLGVTNDVDFQMGDVDGELTYDDLSNKFVFVPAHDLDYDRFYECSLIGAEDSSGNILDDVNFSFTTMSYVNDYVAPEIVSTSIENGAVRVDPNNLQLRITMSEPIPASAVNSTTVAVLVKGGTTSPDVTRIVQGRIITISFHDLNNDEEVVVKIKGITDYNGNAMVGHPLTEDYVLSFETLPTPRIVRVAFNGIKEQGYVYSSSGEDDFDLRRGTITQNVVYANPFELHWQYSVAIYKGEKIRVTVKGKSTPVAPIKVKFQLGKEPYTLYDSAYFEGFNGTVVAELEPCMTSDNLSTRISLDLGYNVGTTYDLDVVEMEFY